MEIPLIRDSGPRGVHSLPPRAMKQYSPPYFTPLKEGRFSTASDKFRGRAFRDGFGMRWGRNEVLKLTTLDIFDTM